MTDISSTNWSETDGSNSQPAPDGAPEGMAPSGVNDTMRMMMGATKRFWDRINGTIQTTNIINAYTYTPSVAAATLAHGEIYTFRCNTANTGASTLNVGVGGARALTKSDGIAGASALIASDLLPGIFYQACWDSVAASFVILNANAAAAIGSLSSDVNAAIRSTSAVIKLDINSVSAAIKVDMDSISAAHVAMLRSTSIVIKTDLGSVSSVITTAFNANDDSTSAVIKADISSVSAVVTTAYVAADRSMSAVMTAAIAAVKSTLYPVGSVYCNYADATNPGTLLGFGTWVTLAAARVLIGVGFGTDINSTGFNCTQGLTGGEYSHALTANEMFHTHAIGGTDRAIGPAGGVQTFNTPTSGLSVGGTSAVNHSLMQPYEAVYMWRRTV